MMKFLLGCSLYLLSIVSFGQDVKKEEVRTIDMHLHTGSFSSMGPLGQQFIMKQLPNFIPDAMKRWTLEQVAQFTMLPYGPLVGIKNQCQNAKLAHCVLYAVYAPKTWGVVPNEEIIGYLDDKRNIGRDGKPYFYGFASLDLELVKVNPEKAFADLRKALSHPLMIGIKLAMVHVMEPIDLKDLEPVYKIASETGLPVYHHVGTTPLTSIDDLKDPEARAKYRASFDPAPLEKVLKKYPKANIILGHMGFDFQKAGNGREDVVLDLAKKYSNAYVEISAFGHPIYDKEGKTMDVMLEKILKLGLQSKTIYGSDGPIVPGFVRQYRDLSLTSMDRTGYSQAEKADVMAENFQRLVGGKLRK
jgi:predicted TIM-barrel fold metal-dependent hydrolase